MLEYIKIGQIVNIHGVKGDVKIYPLTDNINRFKGLKEVYLQKKEGLELVQISSYKMLSDMVVLHIDGVETPEMAQKLRNTYLCVDREHTIKLPKNTWLICDLVGITVKTEADNKELGKISEVLQLGSNDVYVVKQENGGEDILIPALKTVVKKVDIPEGLMIVELPEGLLD